MKRMGILAGVLASLVLASGAEAKGHKDNGNDKDHGQSDEGHCPPGLAKKDNHCLPPGQAKKDKEGHDDKEVYYRNYTVGQDLPKGYVVVLDPSLYSFWDKAAYVRSGGFLYLIDRLTGSVLQNAGPVEDWTWGWSDVDFANCPPGLAKKNPPCVPPGQAKKAGMVDPYIVGDRLPLGYTVILIPKPGASADPSVYARSGDTIYRVAPTTGQVQEQVGQVGRLIE